MRRKIKMKILIDTNIILNVLLRREPFYPKDAEVLKLCGARADGMLLASQTTDIFYMLRRYNMAVSEAKSALKKLTENIKIIDVNAADVSAALESDMADYEDALLAFCAKRRKADCIVTRNEKDFTESPVPAITPEKLAEIM